MVKYYGLTLFILASVVSYYLPQIIGVLDLNMNLLGSASDLSVLKILFLVPLALLAPPILFFLAFKYLSLPKFLAQPLGFIGRYSLYYFTLHIPAFGISQLIQRLSPVQINTVILDFGVSLVVISLGIYLLKKYKPLKITSLK